MLKCYRVDMAF